MPDTAEPTQSRRPETAWEHCLVWASLLLRVHVRELGQQRLTEEQTVTLLGRDRDLVVVLIAGALHAHLRDAGLTVDAAGQIPLAAPNDEGVTGTLRRAAYAALKASPATEVKAREERALLLRAATSGDPDERALWERLRAAALDTVAAVAALMPAIADVPRHPDAAETGRYWERSVALGDVAAAEQRRTAYEAAAAVFGEDY